MPIPIAVSPNPTAAILQGGAVGFDPVSVRWRDWRHTRNKRNASLDVIQEFIVARKGMRDHRDSFRGNTFDSSRCECCHSVKVGLAVGDDQIAESRDFYWRQVSRDEWPRGIQRAVNAISSHIGLSSGIPVDHHAFDPRQQLRRRPVHLWQAQLKRARPMKEWQGRGQFRVRCNFV